MSFKRAAEDLGVTPTAVSHQIRLLEERSGVTLFERGPRSVSHTPKGRMLAAEIGPAIDTIEEAYRTLTRSSERETVILGAGPIVASRWLAPRLPSFAASHPEIDLQLLNSPTEIWRRTKEFDIAIAWGSGSWSGVNAEKLLEVSLVPVLAPSLAQKLGPLNSPADLLRTPLLHHRDVQEWTDWFRLSGVTGPLPSGTSFEDSNVLVQAALSGTGVILGIREFLSDDIATGRLVCPFEKALKPREAYFLVSKCSENSQPTMTLKKWLRANARCSA